MIKPKTRTVRLDEIVVDQRAQTRADGVDAEHVAQMVEAVDDLPPMLCVEFDGKPHLADGFHRMDAYRKAKKIRVTILCAKGTEDDWIDAFASANDSQKGKPRRREDKRNAVLRAIEVRPTWTNVRVAEAARVSESLVRQVRKNDPEVASAGSLQGRLNDPEPTPVISHQGRLNDPEEASEDKKHDACPPGKRLGRDGKYYPATIKSKSADDKPLTQPEPAQKPEPVNQETNVKVDNSEQVDTDTEQSVEEGDPAEQFCGVVSSLCRELDGIGQRVAALKDSPYGRFVHWQSAQLQIKNGRETLWQGRPLYECPYCKVAGEVQPACRCCGGLNVTTKSSHKAGAAAMGDRPS